VSERFEEIDRRSTPIGDISLRRRLEPTLGIDVFEVKLGDEFLMSSLFTVAEVALARLALTAIQGLAPPGTGIDVVVGGLGLGYTARAVLEDSRVRSMHVVEALDEVIEWHERHLVPFADALTSDPRCQLVHGDFFAMLAAGSGFGSDVSGRVHAIVVDIDHSPRHVLDPSHAGFYAATGLQRLADRLHPEGVFALWADGAPDNEFLAVVERVFASCEAHVVTFANFYTGGESASTVYVATV
jgi:spermidine synthase